MSLAYDLDFGVPQGSVQPVPQPGRQPVPRRARPLALVPAPGALPRPSLVPARPGTRPAGRPESTPVALLRPLHDPAPLRLTRRGLVALAAVLAATGLAVVVLAAWSARGPAASSSAPVGPAVVTVQPGDTLWSIASLAAPGEDPRAEIATIDRLNPLHGEQLVPGQRLRVRVR